MHTAPDPITTLPDPAQVSQVLRASGVSQVAVTATFPGEELSMSEGPSGDNGFLLPARKRANLFKRASHAESGDDPGGGGCLLDMPNGDAFSTLKSISSAVSSKVDRRTLCASNVRFVSSWWTLTTSPQRHRETPMPEWAPMIMKTVFARPLCSL